MLLVSLCLHSSLLEPSVQEHAQGISASFHKIEKMKEWISQVSFLAILRLELSLCSKTKRCFNKSEALVLHLLLYQ